MLEGGTDHRVADGVNVPPSGETMPVAPADVARLGLHIRPRKADLLADDNDLGRTTTRTSPVCLSPGDHVLELRYPGYQTLRIRLDVKKGQVSDLHYKRRAGSRMDERSSKVVERPASSAGTIRKS